MADKGKIMRAGKTDRMVEERNEEREEERNAKCSALNLFLFASYLFRFAGSLISMVVDHFT